jgi:hypothetical protein
VGWLLAFALLVVASGVTGRYAKYGLLVRPQSLPAAIYAVAYSSIALPPIAECLSFRSSADADRVAAHAALAVVGLGHGGRSTAGGGVRSPGAVRAALPVGRQPAGGARPGGSATSSAPSPQRSPSGRHLQLQRPAQPGLAMVDVERAEAQMVPGSDRATPFGCQPCLGWSADDWPFFFSGGPPPDVVAAWRPGRPSASPLGLPLDGATATVRGGLAT